MGASRLRVLALLGVGALAVHEARFALASLWAEPAQRTGHAHGYLGLLAVVALLGLLAAVAQLVCALLRRSTGPVPRAVRLRRAWLGLTLALLAVYGVQEVVEGALAGESALTAALGAGGWIALPLSAAVGWLGALLLCGAAAVLAHATGRRSHRRRPRRTSRRPVPLALPRQHPLARHLAGRAPPVVSA